jgi:hypothetical protein
MQAIKILRLSDHAQVCFNGNWIITLWRSPMKSESPSPNSAMLSYCQEDPKTNSSRLTDEKISDDSGAEAKTTSALAPAGLKNPFWSKASA